MKKEPKSVCPSEESGPRQLVLIPTSVEDPPREGDIILEAGREMPRDSATRPQKGKVAIARLTRVTLPKKTIERSGSSSRKKGAKPRSRVTAEIMAGRQRDISVSEFFTKNRHLLGFDNPQKALLTTVKEAVDNSLDACEDAGILPVLRVEVHAVGEDRYRIVVEDNGPGIVKSQIPRIFGKLLYGSKFHISRQSRGQQGIGISAAGMYGQLTTGKSMRITSATVRQPAHYFEIQVDTRRNVPQILVDREVDWESKHGTRVELELAAVYKKGRHSVEGYIEQTAVANPHAEISFLPPDNRLRHFPATSQELPPEPKEIKPHPYGVELGVLIKMLRDTRARRLFQALQEDFSRVSEKVALNICEEAGLSPKSKPHTIANGDAEKLYRAINRVKIMNPPTNCLSPIGEELILRGLQKQMQAEFYAACSRPPGVYRGNPFQIEAALAYGGDLKTDDLVHLMRFANRVPLSYQQSACAITKAVMGVDWRSYGLSQNRGALPAGPALIFVHIASVWVPFTSESKEAIAGYPEIIKEIRLALQGIGRKLQAHVRRNRRAAEEAKKKDYIEKFIPHIGIALREILDLTEQQELTVVTTLKDVLERSRK